MIVAGAEGNPVFLAPGDKPATSGRKPLRQRVRLISSLADAFFQLT